MKNSFAIAMAAIIGLAVGSTATYLLKPSIPEKATALWLAAADKETLIHRIGEDEYQIDNLNSLLANDDFTSIKELKSDINRLHSDLIEAKGQTLRTQNVLNTACEILQFAGLPNRYPAKNQDLLPSPYANLDAAPPIAAADPYHQIDAEIHSFKLDPNTSHGASSPQSAAPSNIPSDLIEVAK